MEKTVFVEGDRVMRIDGTGCLGSVVTIAEETMQKGDSRDREKPVIIGVQWDNGTLSYFGPKGLKKAEK